MFQEGGRNKELGAAAASLPHALAKPREALSGGTARMSTDHLAQMCGDVGRS